MTITEETAQQLIEKLDKVLKVISPKRSQGKKSKRQQLIDAKTAQLSRKYLKKLN